MTQTSILQCAKEYNVLVGKVNCRLKSLKTELLELKKQDVSLLRQLIHINDVIQTLCQHTPSPDSAVDESPTEMFHRAQKAPLVRQQSVPYYVSVLHAQSIGSFNSSFEGISEQAEDDADMYSNDDSDSLLSVSLNNSTIPLCIKPTVLHRSLSCEEHDGRSDSLVGLDDSFFENVLQKNIALWKNQTKTNQEHIYENVKTDVT